MTEEISFSGVGGECSTIYRQDAGPNNKQQEGAKHKHKH